MLRAVSVMSQMGLIVVSCVAVGVFLGWLLDNFLGTSPWLLLIFSLLGMGAALKSLFDFAQRK